MLELKLDPWRPDHGAGAEVSFEEVMTDAVVDASVETTEWARPLEPEERPPEPCMFVDGVMRTELRVLARDGDKRAWGLLGSCLAGGVRCDGSATFVAEAEPVTRALLMGGCIDPPALELAVGAHRLSYEPHAVANDTPTGLRRGLQRMMLSLEGELAARLARDALVFADGPLHLDGDSPAPVVGVVKRMVTAYLSPPEEALLPRLAPGQRTPLFALGNGVLDRYAWYQRLVPRARSWHELAALVRCEVRMGLGLARARAIADLVACHLPAFAGRPGVDPRAPQNLTPVGALESRLKHRLGSTTLIERALRTRLSEPSRA